MRVCLYIYIYMYQSEPVHRLSLFVVNCRDKIKRQIPLTHLCYMRIFKILCSAALSFIAFYFIQNTSFMHICENLKRSRLPRTINGGQSCFANRVKISTHVRSHFAILDIAVLCERAGCQCWRICFWGMKNALTSVRGEIQDKKNL